MRLSVIQVTRFLSACRLATSAACSALPRGFPRLGGNGRAEDAFLWIAFALLALVTYVSGLRSAVLMAIVKDIFIWVTVIIAVIYIPLRLGGYARAFAAVPQGQADDPTGQAADYMTPAIGSGLWAHSSRRP